MQGIDELKNEIEAAFETNLSIIWACLFSNVPICSTYNVFENFVTDTS